MELSVKHTQNSVYMSDVVHVTFYYAYAIRNTPATQIMKFGCTLERYCNKKIEFRLYPHLEWKPARS